MQEMLDAYREVQKSYFALASACEKLQTRAELSYPQANGKKVWSLLKEVQTQFMASMDGSRASDAVVYFAEDPSEPNARMMCRKLTAGILDFNKLFVRECMAERSDSWEEIRQHYSNSRNGTREDLYTDLKEVYDNVEDLLTHMNDMAVQMQKYQDFVTCENLRSLDADLTYWAQVAGQWFNYVCTNIATDSSTPPARSGPAAPTAPRSTGAAQRGTADPAPSMAQEPWQRATPPAGSAASGRPPMVPTVKKARSVPKKRESPFARRFSRGSKTLTHEHAEEIANAIRYNAMTVQLLVRRIRKDLTGRQGPLGELYEYTTSKEYRSAYAGIESLQGQLRDQLNAVEDLVDVFKGLGNIVREGRNSATVEAVSKSAKELNMQLVRIGNMVDVEIANAASLKKAIIEQKLQPPSTMDQWWTIRNDFTELERLSQSTGKKCRNVVTRINKIVRDEDFKHKHLSFQGIQRITGWKVAQAAIEMTCMTTIDQYLIEAESLVATLKRRTASL
ncbi:hypothetical protein OTB20_38500 [Streptomyces sp. H27-H1]|nr:hypothetical protein [Streptomyces sp. H27-H1]